MRALVNLFAILSVMAGACAVCTPALAEPQGRASAGPRAMSLDEAVSMAERRFHARVVRADSQQEGGHTVYVLRLLNDSGRVWTVRVDAETGAVH
jgi:uncharacterized membrane protein YkoI